jgi:multidrug efflux pump subunit AcrA (membrane-fusion protein)
VKKNLALIAGLPILAVALPTGCVKNKVAPELAGPVVLIAPAVEPAPPTFFEAVAKLDGSTHTAIVSTVSGYLLKQAAPEGSLVQAGDVLFQIDPRPYQVELNSGPASRKIASGPITIKAPVQGVVGKIIPGLGDLISRGMTLTTLSTLDPIRADFLLPEKSAATLQDGEQRIEVTTESGHSLVLRGQLFVDRQTFHPKGVLTAYLLLPNSNRALQAGDYARIRIDPEQTSGAVEIPPQGIILSQSSSQVMVVRPDDTVEVRSVKTGNIIGSDEIITSGLKAGERVIVGGMQNVREGSHVRPRNYVAPDSETPPSQPSPVR